MRIQWLGSFLFAAILLTGVNGANAQSTFGSIVGTVQDQTGAVIGQVPVTVRNIDENISQTRPTNDAGEYLFLNLKPGRYELSADKAGFSQTRVFGISLDARQERRVNLQLSVQAVSQSVEVTAGSATIDTENATIADSKDGQQIAELPVNYRGATTSPLAALVAVPGVQQDSNGNVSLNGGFPTTVGYSLDGISTINVLSSNPNGNMYSSSELIGEFRVSGVSNNAEFAQSGDITVTTKSGGNTYHGSAFEYLQNAALDATTYGAPVKQTKVGNTFGVSLGGPVLLPRLYDGHDRTFFFADYEGNRLPHSTLGQYLLPTERMRGGDLSEFGQSIEDPEYGGTFSGAQIPSQRISSVATALLKYYPTPPAAAGLSDPNYSVNLEIPINTNGYDVRVDRVISTKQQFYGRWSWKSLDNTNWPGLGTSYSVVQSSLVPASHIAEHNRNLVLSHSYALRSSLQNEFRYGLSLWRSVDKFPLNGEQVDDDLGLQGLDLSAHPTSGGFPVFDFSTGTGFTPIGRQKDGPSASSVYQFTDNLSWTKGRHTLKFGADAQYLGWKDVEHFAPGDDYGDFYFTGEYTQNAFADFLLGLPTYNAVVVTGPNLDSRSKHFGFYGQDEYHASQKLTISVGLRWELHPPFTEQSGNIANFDPVTNSVVVPDHTVTVSQDFLTSINACPGTDAALACTNFKTASQLGFGSGLRATYFGNWDPRFGVAYRPFGDTKTVIRAGFGIFTPSTLGALSYLLSGIASNYFATFSTGTGSWPPAFQFPQAEPAGQSTSVEFIPGSSEFECAVDTHLRDAASEQWNLTVERQLPGAFVLQSSYIGSNSYRMQNLVNANQQRPSTTPFNALNSPFPDFDQIVTSEAVAGANYQAWQTQINRRFKQGAYIQGSYTWAKNLTNNEGTGPTGFPGEYGGNTTDRFNLREDRGNDYGTRRQRLLLTGLYELPFGRGRAILANANNVAQLLVGGWKVSTITLVETGPFQTPTISCAYDQSNTNPEAGMNQSCRPDRIGNGNIHKSGKWFNPSAFEAVPAGAGRDGNAGVGILVGPGTVTVAGGLAKEASLSERVKVRFESSFTNLLNHSNYAGPSTVWAPSSTSFGVITSVQTSENAGNRTGQLALRLEF
jgi:hypothetical protein